MNEKRNNHRRRSEQKNHRKYYMQIYANTFESLKKKKVNFISKKKCPELTPRNGYFE